MTDYIIALLVIIIAVVIIKKVTTCLIKSIVGFIALAIIAYLLLEAGFM